MGCHDGSNAPGKDAAHIATTDDCITCHTSTVSWLGAIGAMPANHIPFNAGVMCTTCHPTPTTWITGAALHAKSPKLQDLSRYEFSGLSRQHD